jgi:small GTP-binding protein
MPGPRPARHKVVFIGPSSAGKTNIIQRFAKRTFYEQQPTIGTAFYSREVGTGDGKVSLNIWDTAGMEVYKSLVPKYLKGASAAIAVFDITDPESYEAAKGLLAEAPNSAGNQLATFFVANKIDLGCAVDIQAARDFAEQTGAVFIETSAKSGENVDNLFAQVAARLVGVELQTPGVDLLTDLKKENKGAETAEGAECGC